METLFALCLVCLVRLRQWQLEERVCWLDWIVNRRPMLGRVWMVVGQLRRMLRMTVVRANFDCLLSRMPQVEEEAKIVRKRREVNVFQEDIMRKERK